MKKLIYVILTFLVIVLTLLLTTLLFTSFSNPNPYRKQCEKYEPIARYFNRTHGVPVSVQLAQFIIESGMGRSGLAKNANNLFGIRCGDGWKGERYYSKSGCWRKYQTNLHSWEDYCEFICKYYPNAIGKNYKYYGRLEGYGGAGYWRKIERTIKSYKLHEFD